MGRPTFIIDPQRLRDLRTEAGKTQLDVAKDLQAKLDMKHPSNDATLLSGYQRIERTGNTSRQRAEALADIFEVTIEVLQGKGTPEPSDYLARITSLLREQFSTGTNEVLIRALEQSAGTSELNDESISLLAEDIADRIEAAQLGRNPSELAELTEITGLPESELLKPANVHGYWLFIANGPGIHCTELVRGTSGVAWCVRDIVKDSLDSYGSDGSIRMFRDEPWHIHICYLPGQPEIDGLHAGDTLRIGGMIVDLVRPDGKPLWRSDTVFGDKSGRCETVLALNWEVKSRWGNQSSGKRIGNLKMPVFKPDFTYQQDVAQEVKGIQQPS